MEANITNPQMSANAFLYVRFTFIGHPCSTSRGWATHLSRLLRLSEEWPDWCEAAHMWNNSFC